MPSATRLGNMTLLCSMLHERVSRGLPANIKIFI